MAKTGKKTTAKTTEETVEYEVGDTVQLKSGGPKMTVQETRVAYPPGNLRCQWFSGSKLNSGVFPPEAIQPVKDALPKKG